MWGWCSHEWVHLHLLSYIWKWWPMATFSSGRHHHKHSGNPVLTLSECSHSGSKSLRRISYLLIQHVTQHSGYSSNPITQWKHCESVAGYPWWQQIVHTNLCSRCLNSAIPSRSQVAQKATPTPSWLADVKNQMDTIQFPSQSGRKINPIVCQMAFFKK